MIFKKFLLPRFNDIRTTLSSSLIIQSRTAVFPADLPKPIVNKTELDQLKPDDPIHFNKIRPPDGSESPALFHDPKVSKFIKMLLRKGDYSLARSIVEKAFYTIKLKQIEKWHSTPEDKRGEIETDPRKIFYGALENCKPIVKLMKIIKSGVTYPVPVPLKEKEQEFLAMKNLIAGANVKQKKMGVEVKLAYELLEAYRNEGVAVKKKIELHRQAEANRAYAHYRWK